MISLILPLLGSTLAKRLAPYAVVLAGLLAVWGYGAFQHHQGVASGRAEVQEVLETYRGEVESFNLLQSIAQKTMDDQQEVTRLQLIAQLDKMDSRKPEVRIKIERVIEYVSRKADAQCVVPDGAVWLLDLPSSSERQATGVSESGPKDVDAPSGIALSGVVEVTAGNLQECTERGTVIKSWQDWYLDTQRAWNAYIASLPNQPPVPK